MQNSLSKTKGQTRDFKKIFVSYIFDKGFGLEYAKSYCNRNPNDSILKCVNDSPSHIQKDKQLANKSIKQGSDL